MRFMDDSDIAVKARALAELQGWNSRPQGLPGNLKPQLRRFETMDLSNAIRRMPERGPY
jgi:hypothetical protein